MAGSDAHGGTGWYADPGSGHALRYWNGIEWTQHVADVDERVHQPPVALSLVDWCIGAVLIGFGTATWLFLVATSSSSANSDPFDSPFWNLSWLAVAMAAMVAGYLRGAHKRPIAWATCLSLPGAVVVVLIGTVFYDSRGGASFWPVGEIFVGIESVWAFGAAQLGAAARRRLSASA
jgi:hypothetical protein